jgi:microcystin-dependent protein
MSAKLDWEEIQAQSLNERNIIALTHVGAILILACNAFYRQRYFWQFGGEDITDTQWDEIGHTIGRMEHELMSGLIGAILPHVMASLTGLTMLPCEGSTYNRVDYPLLYAAIDAEFIIDADTFRVPDLRDKFPLAAGDNFPIGTTGGEEMHQLTIAEMPEHLHRVEPHTHSEIGAVASVINGGLEAPASAAQVLPTTTGLEAPDTEFTGGGEEHNNMPPFVAIRWAIVAG